LRLIGYAFTALATYLLIQSSVVLITGYRPRHSVLGIVWTAVTAAVMFALHRTPSAIKQARRIAAGEVAMTRRAAQIHPGAGRMGSGAWPRARCA
jgi:hypothetical protein